VVGPEESDSEGCRVRDVGLAVFVKNAEVEGIRRKVWKVWRGSLGSEVRQNRGAMWVSELSLLNLGEKGGISEIVGGSCGCGWSRQERLGKGRGNGWIWGRKLGWRK
jgi:hypothetical protein